MPSLLRREALRLLEGGIESYLLALCGASLPNLRPHRLPETRYAPVIGLLGATIELLVKACLVQGYGPEIMKREDGFYKFGSESLDEYRSALRTGAPELAFLWEGTKDPDVVRNALFDYASKFRLLQEQRAGGLHAGVGPSKDVLQITALDVYGFVSTLSLNRRFRPYLKNLPAPESPVVKRAALLEDLSRRLSAARDLGEKAELLRAVYLVLPQVPDAKPEWIEAFDRVAATPSEDDVTYLLNTLVDAHGMSLFRQRGAAGEGLPFKVVKDDPHAIPISIEFLKREFTKIPEQFNADVANANGRLKSGILDLPPEDFLLDLVAVGIENTGVSEERNLTFTAQQTWPFVASALSVPGNARPYWQFVAYCDEHDKLAALLRGASQIGNAYLKARCEEATTGIQLLRDGATWDETFPLVEEVKTYRLTAENKRAQLNAALERNLDGEKRPCEVVLAGLARIMSGEPCVGIVLQDLVREENDEATRRYWARLLSEVALHHSDLAGLVAVLRTDNLSSAWTAARKALRVIDAIEFGPSIPGVARTRL